MEVEELKLTQREREVMLHALGLTASHSGKMRRWANRNYFCTGKNTGDYLAWLALVRQGLAFSRPYRFDEGSDYYCVTEAGVKALGEDIYRRVPSALRYSK